MASYTNHADPATGGQFYELIGRFVCLSTQCETFLARLLDVYLEMGPGVLSVLAERTTDGQMVDVLDAVIEREGLVEVCGDLPGEYHRLRRIRNDMVHGLWLTQEGGGWRAVKISHRERIKSPELRASVGLEDLRRMVDECALLAARIGRLVAHLQGGAVWDGARAVPGAGPKPVPPVPSPPGQRGVKPPSG